MYGFHWFCFYLAIPGKEPCNIRFRVFHRHEEVFFCPLLKLQSRDHLVLISLSFPNCIDILFDLDIPSGDICGTYCYGIFSVCPTVLFKYFSCGMFSKFKKKLRLHFYTCIIHLLLPEHCISYRLVHRLFLVAAEHCNVSLLIFVNVIRHYFPE